MVILEPKKYPPDLSRITMLKERAKMSIPHTSAKNELTETHTTPTYARARLWLGMTGVGLQVVIATYILATGLHAKINAWQSPILFDQISQIILVVGAYSLLMIPLDWLGGYFLPKWYGRSEQSSAQYFRQWIRGVAVQFFLLSAVAYLLITAGSRFGNIGVLSLVVVLGLLLISFQSRLARVFGSFNSVPLSKLSEEESLQPLNANLDELGWNSRRISIWDSSDVGFTGGITGLRPSIVFPLHWVKSLPANQLKIVLARRVEIIQGSWRIKGITTAFLWVLTGCLLSLFIVNQPLATVATLVQFYCLNNLWIFIGLLVLPTLSRNATLAIDRKLLKNQTDEHSLIEQHSYQDRLQDNEPQRSTLVETIFHPIPSVANRSEPQSNSGFKAWHAARTMLLLSYACGGFLARSVHCNLGRPELWIFLPTN